MFGKKLKTFLITAFVTAKYSKKGQGMAEAFLVTCIALIVGAYIIIPQFRDFCSNLFSDADNWYNNTIKSKIFPSS